MKIIIGSLDSNLLYQADIGVALGQTGIHFNCDFKILKTIKI